MDQVLCRVTSAYRNIDDVHIASVPLKQDLRHVSTRTRDGLPRSSHRQSWYHPRKFRPCLTYVNPSLSARYVSLSNSTIAFQHTVHATPSIHRQIRLMWTRSTIPRKHWQSLLAYPQRNAPTSLMTDASDSAVLRQLVNSVSLF